MSRDSSTGSEWIGFGFKKINHRVFESGKAPEGAKCE
jgi:hypothetical protein